MWHDVAPQPSAPPLRDYGIAFWRADILLAGAFLASEQAKYYCSGTLSPVTSGR